MNREQIKFILSKVYPFLAGLELDHFLQISTFQKLKNKTKLIEAGHNSPKIFFILKGMVRGYYINQKGQEINVFLRPEHTMTGAPDTLFTNKPTKYTFEAILETDVLFFSFRDFEVLMDKYPKISKVYIDALEENLQTLIFRVESLIDKLPEERYDELLEKKPTFFQKAFNKHIANYLGITPNSLSRIIKRKKTMNS
ncbi:MAG: Crp/Fnr family transcriptional regulator [Chitinophagales bacterium]